jgi:hypothetical protein
MNSLLTERMAVVGVIDPDAYTAGTYTTGWISLADFDRFAALVLAGDLGTSATIDAKLTGATSSTGANPQDIQGAAVTQLTQAGTDSNKQAWINLNTDALAGRDFTHFRLALTVGTATSDAGAIVFGFDPSYVPMGAQPTIDSTVSV